MTRTLGALALAVGFLVACGNDGGTPAGRPTGRIPHPTGAADVVLRVSLTGGFVHPSLSNSFPEVTLYGDGRVITRGPTTSEYPGPALANLVEFRLDEAGIQRVLRAAADAGALDRHPPDYGRVIAADVPSTVVTVHTDGALHRVSVFGLGLDPEGRHDLDDAQIANRRRLRDAVALAGDRGALQKFVQPGSERRYEPTAVAVSVTSAPDASNGTAHPWPVGNLTATGCTVYDGADAAAVLAAAHGAHEGDLWESAGAAYSVAFRPLLPDERTCDDLTRHEP